jgi:hypothetical protein
LTNIDESTRGRGVSAETVRTGASAVREKRLAATNAAPSPVAAAGPSPAEKRVESLARALTRARIENAEQSAVLADLRGAEIARLEILREQLAPVAAQLPQDCDLFDFAISPGERPRLFIDHIGFVEMARDRRSYRFLQDTRHGRIVICENDKTDTLIEAITAYIAHRLIEREKALAVDYASGGAAQASAARAAARVDQSVAPVPVPAPAPVATAAPAFRLRAMQLFLFVVELLGSATFFGLLALLAVWAYRNMAGQ